MSGNAARPGRQWRPVAQHRRQPAARAGRLRRRRPAGPAAGRGHGPVAPARSLSAAHVQRAGADPGAGLAALRAAAGGHRRSAQDHPHRQGGAGARDPQHAAGLSPSQPGAARGGSRLWLHASSGSAGDRAAAGHAHAVHRPAAGLHQGLAVAGGGGAGGLQRRPGLPDRVRPPAVPAGSGHGRRDRGGRDRLRHRPRAGLDRDEADPRPGRPGGGAPR